MTRSDQSDGKVRRWVWTFKHTFVCSLYQPYSDVNIQTTSSYNHIYKNIKYAVEHIWENIGFILLFLMGVLRRTQKYFTNSMAANSVWHEESCIEKKNSVDC